MRLRNCARLLSFAAVVAASLTQAAAARADSGGQGNGNGNNAPGGALDQIFRLEHNLPIGAGRVMHVTETFSARAFLRDGERRAIVMLPGPVGKGNFFNIEVPGYDGGAIMAKHGFFSYAVDFEGTGTSTFPAQGTSVTLDSQVEAVKKVLVYVQFARGVPRVDVLGESWGGGVAAEVCKNRLSARSCILASMIYETPSQAAVANYQSPGWLGFLQSLPNGYLPTFAGLYAPLVANSPPTVQQWTFATQPGSYTVQPLFEFFNLPFFDPTMARVPGLIIQGQNDPDSLPSDVANLAADYGNHGATSVVIIPGGGHIPRIEVAPYNNAYWDAVTDFIDPNQSNGKDCD